MVPIREATNLYSSSAARKLLKEGVDQMANMVKITLGPKGRNVVLRTSFGTPYVTKDGVTVAKHISLKDPAQNLGAQMALQAAARTVLTVGDGTTTSLVLAQAILDNALKQIEMGVSPINLKRGIDIATTQVVEFLKANSTSIGNDMDKVEQIANISANNDPAIAALIRKAMEEVGTTGMVAVADSKGTVDYISTTKGYSFDRGLISPHFVNNFDKLTCELENPYIFVTDRKLRVGAEIVPIVEKVVQAGGQMLIIADEVEAQALSLLVVNKVRMGLNICAVKTPAQGDRRLSMLEDIAAVTGATLISEDSGMLVKDVELKHLGRATNVSVSRSETSIVGGKGAEEVISKRLDNLKAELETASHNEFAWVQEKLLERIAKLSGGVAVINLGAHTEVELKEKKDRVDDALQATKAAITEGVSIGGGYSYLDAISAIDVEPVLQAGADCVKKALVSVFNTVLANAGVNSEVVRNHIQTHNELFDVNKMEYVDVKDCRVIDPTKVLRLALENAASVASMIALTDGIISSGEAPYVEENNDYEY